MVFRLSRKLNQDANFNSFHDSGVFTELESIVAKLNKDEFPKPSQRPRRAGRKKTSTNEPTKQAKCDEELKSKGNDNGPTTKVATPSSLLGGLDTISANDQSVQPSSRGPPVRRSVLRAPSMDLDDDFIYLYGGPEPASDAQSVTSAASDHSAAAGIVPAQLEIPGATEPIITIKMCLASQDKDIKRKGPNKPVAAQHETTVDSPVGQEDVNADEPHATKASDATPTNDANTNEKDSRRRRQSDGKTRSKRRESVERATSSEKPSSTDDACGDAGPRSNLSRTSSHESSDSNHPAPTSSRPPRRQSTGGGARCLSRSSSHESSDSNPALSHPKMPRRQSTGQASGIGERSSLSRTSSHESTENNPATMVAAHSKPPRGETTGRTIVSRSSSNESGETARTKETRTSGQRRPSTGARTSLSRSSSHDSDGNAPAKVNKSRPKTGTGSKKTLSRSSSHDSGDGCEVGNGRVRISKDTTESRGRDKDRPKTTRTTRTSSATRSSSTTASPVKKGVDKVSRSMNEYSKTGQRSGSSSPRGRKVKSIDKDGFGATTTYTWTRQRNTTNTPAKEEHATKPRETRVDSKESSSLTVATVVPAPATNASDAENAVDVVLPPRPQNKSSPRHRSSLTKVRRSSTVKTGSDTDKGTDLSSSDHGSKKDKDIAASSPTNVIVGAAAVDDSFESTASPEKTKPALLRILSQTMRGSPKQAVRVFDVMDKSSHSVPDYDTKGTEKSMQRTQGNALRRFRHLKPSDPSVDNNTSEQSPTVALDGESNAHGQPHKATQDGSKAMHSHETKTEFTMEMENHTSRQKRGDVNDSSSLSVQSLHRESPRNRKSAIFFSPRREKQKNWDAMEKLEASSTWSSFKGFGIFKGKWLESPRKTNGLERDASCRRGDSKHVRDMSPPGQRAESPIADATESPTFSGGNAPVEYVMDEHQFSPMRKRFGSYANASADDDDSSSTGSIGGKALRSIAQQRRLSRAQHNSPIKRRVSLGENMKRCGLALPPSLDDDDVSKNDGTESLGAVEDRLSVSPSKRWQSKVGGSLRQLSYSSLPAVDPQEPSQTDKTGPSDPVELTIVPVPTRARLVTVSDLKKDISKSKEREEQYCEAKSPRKRRTLSEKVSKLMSRK